MTDNANLPEPSVARAFLTGLRRAGVETLYLNAGTDFAPLVEAYAGGGGPSGGALPEPVLAGHEGVVVGMAHGAYLMTGRPQALMVHVSVGTANTACGVINAARDNIPLIVCAGRSPVLEDGPPGVRDTAIQWAQEMYDQAGLVREAVKWDYELRDPRQIAQVVDRAVAVAMTHPRGPVYLTLPREVLASPVPGSVTERPATVSVPVGPAPDPEAVERLADRLADADLPVIATTAAGADPATVPLLAELCERHSIGVAEPQPRYVNAPADHPFHLGYRQEDPFADADVVCFLECSVPWIPRRGRPRDEVFVAQVGADPLFTGYPMRSHRSDLTITSTARAFLTALDEALSRRAPADLQRRDTLVARSAAARERAREAAERTGDGPITSASLSSLLGQALAADDDMVLFNEYSASVEHIRPRRPGCYFWLPAAGGLGWGLPAALGAKHAAPGRTVVAAVGDGAYLFANPAACHHASARHDLPVLTVVVNNSRWGAVDWSTRLVYPDGEAVRNAETRLSSLDPMPAIERYAEASGGYGERVDKPEQLPDALEHALHAVRVERRQALLNVICA